MRAVAKGGAVAAAVLASLAGAGCTLEEITLVEAEDVVVGEVYVQVSAGPGGESRATAWLHRTLEGGSPASHPVPGAEVLITSSRGLSLELASTSDNTCAWSTPVEGTGTCYATSAELAGELKPGDVLEVEIALPGGGLLRGASTVPGDFRLVTPGAAGRCRVDPLTPFEVRWSASAGAWAYVNETLISGLRAALAPQGITVEKDPLYLLGLAVSSSDTTIVFPGEFGVFDRFGLDQGLALALQKGLPGQTEARVTITAADRNYVNWVRGGNFNPSGLVKIPSLRGDGTGVFAATLSRSFEVVAGPRESAPAVPGCAGG
ncbi:MAG: hypothetical protein Q8N53_08925 [Longimicrobiales bacterium]|nr:hypothetical protein [Longimicrobiales bacterium]